MTPRLLLNENFPQPSVNRLREAGWDVLAIAEAHASIDDPAVMRLARETSRWLITFDRDYGELVFRQHLPPPPLVLLLRVPSYLPEEPAGWIEMLYRRVQPEDGQFCICDGETVRRRAFPVRSPTKPH
jgi:predicted nuclease of predicted toxin-antitoxin system